MFSIRLIKTTCTFIFFIICSVLVDSSCLYSDEPLSEQKIKDLLFLQNFDAVASIPHAADDYMRMYYSAAAYFSMAQRDWYKKDIREKHIENCIEKYKTVSEKSPDEDLKSRGLLWYGISLMLFRAKNLNFEQLSAPFLNLINIYPGSTYINDAYFYLGRICRAFNRHEKAHDYFTRLAGSDESDRVFNIYTKKLHLPGELAASYLNIKYIPKAPEPVKPAAALKEPEPPVEKKIESVPEKTEPLPAAAQPEKKTREDPAPVIVPEPEPPKPETEPVKPVPPPPAPEPPRVKKGKIIISGDKPQTLNVNNEPVNFNSEAEFTPGNYTIRASLAGCHDITLPAVIKDGETTSIELKFRKIILYGTLAVKSEPAGAVIFIDDKETGKTPWQQQKIETGEKLVRLEFTGQKPIIERVLIEPNQTKNLFYSFSPLPATLELTCNEKDTVLKITGSATNLSLTCGQSKITLELPGGEYKIESSKDGFLTAEKKLSIIQGKKYSDKITLEPSIRLAVQTEYSRSGTDKKSLNYPTALYIYKSTLYIIDASLNRMMAFTPDMKFLFNAGGNGSGINPSTKKKDGSGSGPQELNNPRGLAVFNNKIFIT
ncbi:MAG TPA: hypothetical protein DC049_02970, partial [Spirochaetia bacterium]|nr:hypothetical protein [Spirochaetia bacterium]